MANIRFSLGKYWLLALVLSGQCCVFAQPQYVYVAQSAPLSSRVGRPDLGLTQGLVDQDKDGIEDALENELILRFAPLVKLHPDERFMPINVEWYLQRVFMAFYVCENGGKGTTLNLPRVGEVNIDNMLSYCRVRECAQDQIECSGPDHPDYPAYSVKDDDRTHFFLSSADDNDFFGINNPLQWACYAHVTEAPAHHPNMYDVQYFFPYALSGAIDGWGKHEGDWERVTVRVRSDTKTIHGVYFAAHDNEGQWYPQQNISGFSTTSDGRPIVYSAKGSHASYPWAGRWSRGWVEKPDDHTADGGRVWDCRNSIANLGEKEHPNPGFEWIRFTGHWGDCNTLWVLESCGPHGPAFQAAWTEGESLDGDNPYDYGWRFVDQSRPSTNNLGTWADPYREFTDAAKNVPVDGNIVILPGTYRAVGSYRNSVTLHAPKGEVVLGN